MKVLTRSQCVCILIVNVSVGKKMAVIGLRQLCDDAPTLRGVSATGCEG